MANYGYNRRSKAKKTKKIHFAALCLCMAALGATSWVALKNSGAIPQTPTEKPQSSEPEKEPDYVFDTVVGKPGPQEPSKDDNLTLEKDENKPNPKPDIPAEDITAGTEATFFVMPVAGNLKKGYSPHAPLYSETYCDFRTHSGADIETEVNAAVLASGHGTVRAVRYDSVLGNVVEIDHGNGIVCFYCGLTDHILVTEGQSIEASQPIGTVGTVPGECAEAPHLHLEAFKDGKPTDPMNLLGLK